MLFQGATLAVAACLVNFPAAAFAQNAEVQRVVFPNAAAWKASGADTLARAETAAQAAEVASDSAVHETGAADRNVLNMASLVAKVGPIEEEAARSKGQAIKAEAEAKAMAADLEERAYVLAKAAASKEVQELEKEGEEYFAAQVAAHVPKKAAQAQAEVAQNTAPPFVEAGGKIHSVILQYNGLATQLAQQVIAMTKEAQELANMATQQQASGNTELAQKNMLEAHRLLSLVPEKKARALKIRQLVEHMNNAAPVYKQAARVAADKAAAVALVQLQTPDQAPSKTTGNLRRAGGAF